MKDVVPPEIAALDPLSKSSRDCVPIKGNSMWVWGSIPPGMISLSVQSITYAFLWEIFSPIHETFPF